MVHGFDARGMTVDRKGQQDTGWNMLSNLSRRHFEKESACLVEQYRALDPNTQVGANYIRIVIMTLLQLGQVDGDALNENVADNVGIKLAFDALQHYLEKHSPQDPLLYTDQLWKHFNVEKQFFVAFAHVSVFLFIYYFNSIVFLFAELVHTV